MSSIKLKYKIEILYKLIKQPFYDELKQSSKIIDKSKSIPSSAKQSVRNSKIISSDLESLPGFERELSKLPIEEKDEILTIIKNIDFSTLITIFTIIQNKQFYNKLKSKPGLEVLRNTFKEILRNKSEFSYSKLTDNLNLQETLFINDECELYVYLKDYLNLTELDAMDIYDIFKYNEFFAITEKIFIILIFLLASYECGRFEDFISIFSEDVFNTLSSSEKYIDVSRLKEVGRILNFDERIMTKVSNDLLDLNYYVDVMKFREFYLTLGKIYDEKFKAQSNFLLLQQSQQGSPAKGKPDAKAKGSGCISKQCNIL